MRERLPRAAPPAWSARLDHFRGGGRAGLKPDWRAVSGKKSSAADFADPAEGCGG